MPRLIAYYLPQYHPIPENDEWWGNGFTEWTNVAKAKPLFREHYQPHLPADLGFYDLRVPEVREAQAELARFAGIEGFCYWHYWFAGKQLLDRPFSEVLSSGRPDFPFCLAWANQSWTGIWHGNPDKVLIEQTYPGYDDHLAHFNALLPAFLDPRYLRVDGKPIFLIFQPGELSVEVIQLWQRLAQKAGLPGLHLTGIINKTREATIIQELGYSACTISRASGRGNQLSWDREYLRRIVGEGRAQSLYKRLFRRPYYVFDSREASAFQDLPTNTHIDFYPCIIPGFDNSPRTGLDALIFTHSCPEVFIDHLQKAAKRVASNPPERQIIILKSWNEWAEGNYLEPDQRFGHAFLDALRTFMHSLK